MRIHKSNDNSFLGGWNFGPDQDSAKPVRWILEECSKYLKKFEYEWSKELAFKESHYLKLDSTKAQSQLGWSPVWGVDDALEKTIEWYKNRASINASTSSLMIKDIHSYWE